MFSLAEPGKCFVALMFFCTRQGQERAVQCAGILSRPFSISDLMCANSGDTFSISDPDHISLEEE